MNFPFQGNILDWYWNVSREVAVVPIDNKKVDPKFMSYFIASGISQKWFGGVKKTEQHK